MKTDEIEIRGQINKPLVEANEADEELIGWPGSHDMKNDSMLAQAYPSPEINKGLLERIECERTHGRTDRNLSCKCDLSIVVGR